MCTKIYGSHAILFEVPPWSTVKKLCCVRRMLLPKETWTRIIWLRTNKITFLQPIKSVGTRPWVFPFDNALGGVQYLLHCQEGDSLANDVAGTTDVAGGNWRASGDGDVACDVAGLSVTVLSTGRPCCTCFCCRELMQGASLWAPATKTLPGVCIASQLR